MTRVCTAALCAVACWRGLGLVPLFMGISALATAAADTTGSEIGKLLGKRAFLPLTFKRVERGTDQPAGAPVALPRAQVATGGDRVDPPRQTAR